MRATKIRISTVSNSEVITMMAAIPAEPSPPYLQLSEVAYCCTAATDGG